MAQTTKPRGLAQRLYTGDLSYDFVGRRRLWYIISAILITISVLALLIRGLDLGIEFRGGSDFQAPVQVTSYTISDVRDAVIDTGVPNLGSTTVTTIGDSKVRVQTRSLSVPEQTEVRAAIAAEVGIPPDQVAYQLIGASWGRQITQQAAIALVVFIVLVGILIWLYFRDSKMSIAALVALAHDLIITIGVYALVGFTVTPATMIGVLTILGYSLYDTVVVFDKVRENVVAMENRRVTFAEAANTAINQVLVRSLNTTIIGVLPVAAILFAGVFVLGSGPLEDLGLALFVGMIAGAYSSIFIATPLLVDLRNREPGVKAHNARVLKRRKAAEEKAAAEKANTVDQAADDEPEASDEAEPVAAGVTVTTAGDSKQPATAAAKAKAASSSKPAGKAKAPGKSGSSSKPSSGTSSASKPSSGSSSTSGKSSSGTAGTGRTQPTRTPRSKRKR